MASFRHRHRRVLDHGTGREDRLRAGGPPDRPALRKPEQIQEEFGEARVVVKLRHKRDRVGVQAVARHDGVPIQSPRNFHARFRHDRKELVRDQALADRARMNAVEAEDAAGRHLPFAVHRIIDGVHGAFRLVVDRRELFRERIGRLAAVALEGEAQELVGDIDEDVR
jgi:hypothetical protein